MFKRPVVAADGITYEEEAILRHFAKFAVNSTAGSATTGTAVVNDPLQPGATGGGDGGVASGVPGGGGASAEGAVLSVRAAALSSAAAASAAVATSPLTKMRMPHGGSTLVFPNKALKQVLGLAGLAY